VNEDTPFVKISGYVSLPAHAVKSKKEQYFFVNNRFIKNPFLNHAVYEAYKELISYQSHPRYFIFLQLDPKNIDVNIHPTKTEVKFTDDKAVYMLLLSAIKRALGKANAAPSIDFETEMSFEQNSASNKIYTQPKVSYNTGFNPFHNQPDPTGNKEPNRQNWESLFEGFKSGNHDIPSTEPQQQAIESVKQESLHFEVFQLNAKYIVTSYNQNILIVDQQRAHERIVYEHYMHAKKEERISSQQLLFPEQMELSANDFSLVKDLIEEFRVLGFELEIFGKNSIVVNGTPSDMQDFNVVETIEGIIESYKLNTIDAKVEKRDNLCRSIAKNISIKYGKTLDKDEMKLLLDHLMRCENPLYTANGKVVMMDVEYNAIEKFFRRQ
jgi:DNA mismatch repair protein MutL